MALKRRTIAFIGGGHITRIIVENLTRSGKTDGSRLFVSEPDAEKLDRLQKDFAVQKVKSNAEAINAAEFIFCNVLPQVVGSVIEELKAHKIPEDKTIISLAAGIPIASYAVLGDRLPVIRALPNPPSQIGQAIVALAFNPHVTELQKDDVIELFSSLGKYVVLSEDKINAVTALSSPVTAHLFFQAIIDAAVRLGIDRETSTTIACQTITGSMELWKSRQVSPCDLIGEASTPGGISTEIMFTLEKRAFKAIISEAIEAGYNKALQFS